MKYSHYANKCPEKEEAAADIKATSIIEGKDGEAGGDITFAIMG